MTRATSRRPRATSRRPRASAAGTRSQTRALASHVPEVVASLRAETPAPPRPPGRPAIALLMGFPGVGKSHCARLLAQRLAAAHVASDHLRSRLFVAASYGAEENAAVFRIVDGLIDVLLEEGHRVIVDATNLRARDRASYVALARRRGVPLVCILVVADQADVLARLAARRRARAEHDRSDADERVYRIMQERGFEPPVDAYLTIRNGPGVEREINSVAMALEARWSGT